ncbi:MAG: hypothetical protein Unbinned97contig1000_38 [Prokaryotic dsDNA virus sp.]|nr:MAG: hypothetical protein Unbinned97contig1000_38 [Prokaryotic dsDNA virus sp.]|tara:strand:+ start:1064 stop:1333 length:270 start_codon:yes stop_codon:yes gene_type:complete
MLGNSIEAVTLAVVGVSSSGTSAIGLATMTVTNSNTLTTETWIPLGLFLAGVAMTASVVWKVASHKAKTDAKLLELQERLNRLEKSKKK